MGIGSLHPLVMTLAVSTVDPITISLKNVATKQKEELSKLGVDTTMLDAA